MIKPIDYKNIIITLRTILIAYSGLVSERILNVLSARGTGVNLNKYLSVTQKGTIGLGDILVLFELIRDQNGNSYVTHGETTMVNINTYTFHLMIYGNECDNFLQVIKSIFKERTIAEELREKGIYIIGVSNGESINEFINDTMVLRADLDVTLENRFDTPKKYDTGYFNDDGEEFEEETGVIVKNV